MKDHATLINTARGSLVDTESTRSGVRHRPDHALLDVTEPEPLPADSALYDLPNVIITPHIAGSLGTETRRMSDAALDDLERYLDRQGPPGPGSPRGPRPQRLGPAPHPAARAADSNPT